MKKFSIVIAGGGSTYTPGIVMMLMHSLRSGPGQQGISPAGCCGFVAIICDDPLFYRFFAAYSVHFCAVKIAGSYFQIAHLMLYCYIRV